MSEKRAVVPSVTESVGHLFGKRPAEVLTLAAGAVGLLAAQVFGLQTSAQPLILIVAAVPAIVSYVVDRYFEEHLGSVAVQHKHISDELEYGMARTLRKALLGDSTWEDDQRALARLWELHSGHEVPASKANEPAKESDG